MTYNHKPVILIEVPERFKDILLEITTRLDKKDLFVEDLEKYLKDYDQAVKESLLNFLTGSQ